MKPIAILLATAAMAATTAFAATKANNVTQHHITWTFDKEYPVGQFVNGDWWVVGPVNIVAITNDLSDKSYLPTDGETAVSGSTINPAPIDPSPRRPQEPAPDHGRRLLAHGYDSRLQAYHEELNAALPGGQPLSAANPLVLKPSQSLVSTVSWLWRTDADKEAGCPKVPANSPAYHVRPTLRAAAVLTALAEPPPAGSFRPAYSGTEKRMFNVSQIKLDRLLKLDPVGPVTHEPTATTYPALDYGKIHGKASIPQLAYALSHLWLDHQSSWYGDEAFHPSYNMPNYGREMCWILHNSMLALHLDWSKIEGAPSQSDKMPLLINLLQYGIDTAGAADAGSYWTAGGSHHCGRKPAILFAGLLFDDEHMKNVGRWSTGFQDDEPDYVTQQHVDATNDPKWLPDGRAKIRAPYTKELIGMPEWVAGNNAGWDAAYRPSNNAYIPGFALVFSMMEGARALWNKEAYFDYADRVQSRDQVLTEGDGYNRLPAFAQEMWRAYRKNYPTTYDAAKWDAPEIIEYITTPEFTVRPSPAAYGAFRPEEPIRVRLGHPVDLSAVTPNTVTVTDENGEKIPIADIEPDVKETFFIVKFADRSQLRKGVTYTLTVDEKVTAPWRNTNDRPLKSNKGTFQVL